MSTAGHRRAAIAIMTSVTRDVRSRGSAVIMRITVAMPHVSVIFAMPFILMVTMAVAVVGHMHEVADHDGCRY